MTRLLLILTSALVLGSHALAAVPTRDAAILERRAQESGHKTELKTILLDHKRKREGINCAVTKGGRGNVQNPESPANPATGSNAVQRYAPGAPAAPLTGATGGTLSEQQLGSETGKVISGVEATQGTVQATQGAYQARSGEVGSAKTVMEAFDQNSSIRIQNGMSWNQTIATTNLLVQALNALNLANQSDTSQGARVLVGPQPPVLPGRTCPAGMTGSGTSADPCRPSQCSTTPSGTPADPACIVRRYTDSHGNVLTYLELASRRVPDTPVAATRQPNTGAITEADLLEALAASHARAAGQN
ncbi:hypothetical protein [Rhabdaerophilum sp. SD176]|uniref:hypothetical protein n=1 Tax=Rhabdaerophilum sp. SD176 TaxID=2983548 RepID=UPI0024DF8C99|nr:hypothetical protein [Rhabdaerophilum sp. SD176]